MKKAIIISGIIYTVTIVGSVVWMYAFPEKYGELLGKVFTGMNKVMLKEEI